MDRRLTSASLVLCLLVSVVTVAPVGAAPAGDADRQANAAQENPAAPAVEYPSCDSVRITGDAGYAEVHVSTIERGGFDTELRSIELSGNETVLGEDDLFPNGVGSYQGEFIVASVTLFESQNGPAIGSFENPNRKSCFEALPRPPENDDTPPQASVNADPTTVAVGDSVSFDASGTTDDNGVAEYRWDFDGDGTVDHTTGDATTAYTYANDGTYDATVTAVDTSDQVSQGTVQVTVSPPDTAEPTTSPPTTETSTQQSTETAAPPPDTTTSAQSQDTEPATPSQDTETTALSQDTETTTPSQDAETTTPSQDAETSTAPQNTAPAPAQQDSEPSQESAPGDSGAGDDADEPTDIPFSVNASSGANETLVTYNVTGHLVNESDNGTVTAEGSEQAPNTTRAPTVEDDGFESLSYLAVNGTANETAVENLSVDAAVNESRLASLGGNASDVTFYAWDADNDTWIPLNASLVAVTNNTSVTNATANTTVVDATENSSVANTTGDVSTANATANATVVVQITNASVGNASAANITNASVGNASAANATRAAEGGLDYGVYALGLDRPHFVATNVTAPENVSVGETFTVDATIENTGHANGTHAAALSVAGTQVESSNVTLGANESTVVQFDWRFETPGTHTVAVDGSTVEVNVSTAEESASSEGDDPTSASTSAPQSGDAALPSRPGFNALVALFALTGGAFVVLYRE